ncbi:MAG: hypothetical protein ACAI35_27685 [Candidatus Methylacidiphilales bacterium]
MSEFEANAQSSQMAGEPFVREAVSGADGQNGDRGGDAEGSEIDAYRDAVGSLLGAYHEQQQLLKEENDEAASGGDGDGDVDDAEGQEISGQGGGDVNTASGRKGPQYRFRPEDEVEALAFDIRKRAVMSGNSVSMKNALAQAESILGRDTDAATSSDRAAAGEDQGRQDQQQQQQQHHLDDGRDHDGRDQLEHPQSHANTQAQGDDDGHHFPQSVDESTALLSQLRAERKVAMTRDLDFDKVAEIDEQMDHLKDYIRDLKESGTGPRPGEAEQWSRTLDASKAAAVDQYPDTTNRDSALVRRMVELDEVLRQSGNALYSDPDKPLRLAQMAANELGIAPQRRGGAPGAGSSHHHQQQQQNPHQQPFKTTSRSVLPASGSARTTHASNPQRQLAAELDKITDEDSWRTAMHKFKVARA